MSPNKRSFSFRLALALTALLLVAQACDLLPFGAAPTPAGPNETAVSAIITLTAAQEAFNATLTAVAGSGGPDAGATPEAPAPPSETPTPTVPPPGPPPTATSPPPAAPVQPSPVIIIITATPGLPVGGDGGGAGGGGVGQPKIYARVDSNCRAGPGPEYKRLGYLLVGEVSEVYGRNRAWTWWYIREPRRAGIACWVWGGSTRVEGDTGNTPVIIVKATPLTKTPSATSVNFSIQGIKMVKCGGTHTIMIKLKNTGSKRFESAALKVKDLTKNKVLFGPSSSNAPFRGSYSDCSAGGDQLDPGQTRYIGTGLSNTSLSGRRLRVEIQMCTKENMGGSCDWGSQEYKVP